MTERPKSRYSAEEQTLLDIFMDAQATPQGEIFSDNILRGIYAVLRYARSERGTRPDLLPGLRDALDMMNLAYGGSEDSSTRSPHAAPIRRRIMEITTPSYSRDEPFDIYVNGTVHQVALSDFNYESVVKLAGYDPARILSVSYMTKKKGDALREGIMHPGCKPVQLEDGMRFSVGDTGNA